MNRIIFTILSGISILIFTACEKEHPGYLFSNEAAYPIDSLVVYTPASQKNMIAEMKATKENFDNTEEGIALNRKKAELNELLRNLQEQYDSLRNEMWDIDDLMYEAEEREDWDEYDRLEAEYNKVRQQWKAVENLKWDVQYQQLPEIDEQIQSAIGNIESEIVLLQRRLENHVAYTTSVIDKIQGTAPLIYTIAGTRAEQGDADRFAPYLSVMGGGRIIVEWDEHIPVGRYVISLYVENEGWKDLLADVYTIIVK